VNKNNGTLLEVYQTEINRRGKPIKLDISGGRFLAHWKGFLDSEIYQKGRKVTIVGVVKGEEMIRLGEIDYRCLSLPLSRGQGHSPLGERTTARVYAILLLSMVSLVVSMVPLSSSISQIRFIVTFPIRRLYSTICIV